jgi:hypothetical protein
MKNLLLTCLLLCATPTLAADADAIAKAIASPERSTSDRERDGCRTWSGGWSRPAT